MDVQVLCFHIRKLALYRRFDVSAFDDLPARHHPGSIKAAHGECAFAELLRHLLADWRFSISFRRMGNSERTKNALGTTSSISIIGWIPGRISPTCCATRSRCTSSTTILTTRLKSQAFAPLFLLGHPALPTGLSKPTSFPDKIAKKIYNQPCAAMSESWADYVAKVGQYAL